jgi:type I restriction enzyme S subunit
MKGETKRTLTPRLRFPDFIGEPLRQLHLGDVTEDCTTQNGKGVIPAQIMGVSKTEGIIPMQERLIGKDTARYKCLETNWFAYNPMRINIGSIARWKGGGDVLVSPDYVVFRCITEREPSIDPNYLDIFRCSDQWENFVAGSGDGGVRIRIYYKDLARLPITLPTPAEQRKIAACLESLDDWIGAEGRKLEALRSHKKGLMQQLFPRPGESRPRLRFPELNKPGVWTPHKFGDFVVKSFYGTSSSTSKAGKYPVLRMGDMKDGGLDFTDLAYIDLGPEEFESFRLQKGDILLNRTNSRDLVGKISIFDHDSECITASYIVSFRLDEKRINPSFCNLMLNTVMYQSRIKLLATPSISQANINPTTFRTGLEIAVPKLGEQKRIAACLSSLDDLIAAQARKVEGLKTHKKGLMQQLFPSGEGLA